jgi:hypothetical protein
MNAASRDKVAQNCVRILDRIQTAPPEVQLLALASCFQILLEVTGYNPQDALAAVVNLMKDPKHSSRRDHRFDAMKYHVKEELLYG